MAEQRGEKHQLHSVGPFAIGIIPSGFRGRFIAWGDHILSVGGKRTRLLVNLRDSWASREGELLREALQRIFAEAHLHDGDDGAWAIGVAADALNAASSMRTTGQAADDA